MISLGDTVRHQTAGWNLHSIWLLLNMCWWSGWTCSRTYVFRL